MELNKWDKLAIALVGIVVIAVVLQFSIRLVKVKFSKPLPYTNTEILKEMVFSEDLPEDAQKTARKYKAFEEIFDTDDMLFVYGYDTVTFSKALGKDFHREMKSRLKNEHLNYKVLPLKNPNKIIRQIKIDNGLNPKLCLMNTQETEKLEDLFEIIRKCSNSACIFDNVNKKCTFIGRSNPEFVIKTLKKRNPDKI